MSPYLLSGLAGFGIAFAYMGVAICLAMRGIVIWPVQNHPMMTTAGETGSKPKPAKPAGAGSGLIITLLAVGLGVAWAVWPQAHLWFFCALIFVGGALGGYVAGLGWGLLANLGIQRRQTDLNIRLADPSQLAQMINDLRHEIDTKGETAQRMNLLACCLEQQQQYDQALAAHRRAFELNPTLIHQMNIASVLLRSGDHEQADAVATEAAAHPSGGVHVLTSYAQQLANANRVEDARTFLARAEEMAAASTDKQPHEQAWTRLIEETREVLDQKTMDA